MKILHLSHTDLDGYACQFVTRSYLKDHEISFYNSNYGKEIEEKFDMILNEIDEFQSQNKDAKAAIIISDLNLSPVQCNDFSAQIRERKNVKLILLDHHISGAECEKNNVWYYLDDSRCATKICYDFFSSIFGQNERLKNFVDVVNAVDIWLSDDPNFELGKVCMGAISDAKEINKVMFNDKSMEYTFYLLERFSDFVGIESSHIALDDAVHTIKKDFFKAGKNDTLSNLISAYLVRLLTAKKEQMSVMYEGKKGIVTSNIGDVSVIGNDFLLANPDFDFFINATSKKTLSFRANGGVDVSQMANRLVGGGGHVNASGGFFAAFRDGYDYQNIREQIQNLIDERCKNA